MFKYVLKKMSKENSEMEAYFFEENVLWLMIILMHCQIRIVEKS